MFRYPKHVRGETFCRIVELKRFATEEPKAKFDVYFDKSQYKLSKTLCVNKSAGH